MRLHRLIGIIMLLDSRGIMKAVNLAKILETSERTIYRDIDILCEAGLPIMSIPGPNGGYSFMEGYKINSSTEGLKSDDVFTILLSTMGISPEKNTETSAQLKNAVIKLENSLSEEHRQEILKAKDRFFVDASPWWGKIIEDENIDIIKQAILDLKKLKINYKKYGGQVSQRIIRPYGAVKKNSQWYVAAFCEEKNEIRVFKCSRIDSIEVLSDRFTMTENFSLEEFWENSKEQFVKKAASHIPTIIYPVKVKLIEENIKLLDGFNLTSSLKKEDYWILTMDMISFTTACNVTFSLSDRIEVLEPLELRNFIVEKSAKILNLYKAFENK